MEETETEAKEKVKETKKITRRRRRRGGDGSGEGGGEDGGGGGDRRDDGGGGGVKASIQLATKSLRKKINTVTRTPQRAEKY